MRINFQKFRQTNKIKRWNNDLEQAKTGEELAKEIYENEESNEDVEKTWNKLKEGIRKAMRMKEIG